jgi:arylsulfatase
MVANSGIFLQVCRHGIRLGDTKHHTKNSMKKKLKIASKILVLYAPAFLLLNLAAPAQEVTGIVGTPTATQVLDGKQLPPLPPPYGGVIKESAKDSTPWWAPHVVPPKGAPNVLLIMTDDQGYGVSSTFGGVIPTPALDRVARAGIRYTRFHSTSLCSPTRAALITGRNHHSVGSGVVSELSTGFPGYNSIIGIQNATAGHIFKANGYATSWFGKNHNTPPYQYGLAGPFDQWPSGLGFDYFYGFMGGETDQWTPYLFRDHTQVFPFIDKKDYNLTTDLADEAIKYLRDLNAVAPDKPFFCYYVPGGTHSPHQPKPEWIEKFKGKFSMGYEKLRDVIFANQKSLGVIPPDAQLTPWPTEIPKWDSLSFLDKKLFERQAEVFAAYAAYTDDEIGRVIQTVENLGKLDNTIVIYICGDNGTSPEGTLTGAFNQLTAYNGILKAPKALQLLHLEDWGSDKTYPHMAVGWTWAFNTPFKWTKQVASHFGGTRQGLAISWPNHIKDVGGTRDQFHHVIDIMPTLLDVAGIKAPETFNGIPQQPIDGVSMAYTFDRANSKAPSTRTTQYFEIGANRGIYHDGWFANTTPFAPPWDLATGTLPSVIDGYKWELYHLTEDFTQNNDLSAKMPDKLKEMQALFLTEAKKYQVLPLDNSGFSRLLLPRPSVTSGKTEFTYTGASAGICIGNAPNILNKDFTITAEITVLEGGAEGMIATLGGRFGGYGLFLQKGKPVFVYNLLDLERFRWEGGIGGVVGADLFAKALKPGRHTLVFDFKYAGPGPGKGGTGVFTVDGKELDKKQLEHTVPLLMTSDETFDIGSDTRTGVDESYKLPFKFTGIINRLTYKLGPSQISAVEQKAASDNLEKIAD